MDKLPLVDVTARIHDQQARPCAGAVIRMRLCSPDKYQGLVVPREVSGTTDADGCCVLRVFPNALGYEGSVYDVHISFPASGAGGCGAATGPGPLRTIRQKVFVPNADCNLMDILDLTPREPLPAGSLLPEELAGYAAQAGSAATAAGQHVAAAASSATRAEGLAAQAEAAAKAAGAAEDSAAEQAQRAQHLVDSVDERICHFEITVTQCVEETARRLAADAARCVRQQESVSLAAIEERSGEVLDEISRVGSETRSEVLAAVNDAARNAMHGVEDARDTALEELREVGAQFEEDFLSLTERAEGAAKKAGCAAAAAANSAARACECARQAEQAAADADKTREDVLEAARQAGNAAECARSDAQRAEAAADSAQKSAGHAAGSALSAQKAAQAAEASAEDANLAAAQAVAAQQAAAADRAYVAGVAADVEQAVRDVAVDMLTPQVVSEAVERATQEAEDHAAAAARSAATAADSATESTRQANLAKRRADRAEAAQTASEAAARQAGEYAAALKKEFDAETALAASQTAIVRLCDAVTRLRLELLRREASMAGRDGEFVRLADRVTRLELRHQGMPLPGRFTLPPQGERQATGVLVAPVTLAAKGCEPPFAAALRVVTENIGE